MVISPIRISNGMWVSKKKKRKVMPFSSHLYRLFLGSGSPGGCLGKADFVKIRKRFCKRSCPPVK